MSKNRWRPVNAHVGDLIGQIRRIIEEGMACKEFKPGDAESIAGGVFMATTRFHHPAHAKEWASPTINQEFDTVWNLIISGILQ